MRARRWWCPSTWFTRAPRGDSALEAASLTTAGLTAWRALMVHGGLKPGDFVLTLGTGGVSVFALQIAKAIGATVIITSSSDQKLEKARALGADHTINYRRTEQWAEEVLGLSGGRGVDHVIEVGGPDTLPQSIAATRVGGHIALIGVLTGLGGEVPTATLMRRQQRLQGLIVGSRRHQQDFVRALDNLSLRPVIDRVFPLEEGGGGLPLPTGRASLRKDRADGLTGLRPRGRALSRPLARSNRDGCGWQRSDRALHPMMAAWLKSQQRFG
jgi:NADPH:quinone reductase-like Zn-dependent oxidoreductase